MVEARQSWREASRNNVCPREKKEEEENKEEFQKERKAKSTLKELRGGSKEVG